MALVNDRSNLVEAVPEAIRHAILEREIGVAAQEVDVGRPAGPPILCSTALPRHEVPLCKAQLHDAHRVAELLEFLGGGGCAHRRSMIACFAA